MSGDGRGSGGVFAGAGAVAGVIGAAVSLVLNLAPSDDPARPEPSPDLEGMAPEPTVDQSDADRVEPSDGALVFDAAARALREADTFAYAGTVEAPEASVAWPTGLAGGPVEVDGRVDLPVRVAERAVRDGLAADTVVSGRGVWQRAAPTADELGAVPWALVAEGHPALGLARLPELLAGTVDAGVPGPAGRGGRVVAGLVPDLDVGGTIGATGARVDLTVDEAWAPSHVTVTVPRPPGDVGRAGPLFRIDVEVRDLGVAVDLGPPGERELGITPAYSAADLRAAGVVAPVQFTRLPPEMVLARVRLVRAASDPACSTVQLEYRPVVGEGRLALVVGNRPCGRWSRGEGQPLTGAWQGEVEEYGTRGATVWATDGATTVHATATHLSTDRLVDLIGALGPYDERVQPSLTAPPGTPVLSGPPG